MKRHTVTDVSRLCALFLVVAVLAACTGRSAPRVWIDAPLEGSQHELGPINVRSHASNRSGVTEFVLLVNGEEVRRDGSPDRRASIVTLVQSWTPPAEGQYILQVIAYSGRLAGEPATVHVSVGELPATAVPPEPTETPLDATPLPPAVTPGVPACTSDAAFVRDVTVPDGTQMAAGASFDKTWRLRNTGTCAWESGYELRFVSGAAMGAPAAVAAPPTAPGEETDITLALQAPASPGTYRGEWRIADGDGQLFGPIIRVVVTVPGQATPTPTVPATQISFWADDTQIDAGTCTTLRWDVEGVQAVFLDGAGVAGQGSQQVCPCQDQTYTLEVVLASDERVTRQVTISVSGICGGTPIPPADTSGPTIQDVAASADPIYTAYPAGCSPTEVTISARVSDPSGVERVRIIYRIGSGTWENEPMAASGGGIYEITLPSPGVPTTLEYYIRSRDTLGNQTESPHGTVEVAQCSP